MRRLWTRRCFASVNLNVAKMSMIVGMIVGMILRILLYCCVCCCVRRFVCWCLRCVRCCARCSLCCCWLVNLLPEPQRVKSAILACFFVQFELWPMQCLSIVLLAADISWELQKKGKKRQKDKKRMDEWRSEKRKTKVKMMKRVSPLWTNHNYSLEFLGPSQKKQISPKTANKSAILTQLFVHYGLWWA